MQEEFSLKQAKLHTNILLIPLHHKYLVKWKGYDDLEWIPVTQLNCGSLLHEFNKGTRAQACFQAMQAGDDHPRV
ncbi:hypothetical protein PHMEG_00040080, partial [Phytophthora megakarya]